MQAENNQTRAPQLQREELLTQGNVLTQTGETNTQDGSDQDLQQG